MKLFYLPGACSLAPHILMEELGMEFELEKMDKADKASILKYNPKGLVPTLILDGEKVLTEVSVILQFLADQKPETNFIPKAGTWERYKCQEWINYVSSEIHKGIGALFNPDFDDNARAVLKTVAGKKLQFLDDHFSKNKFLMDNMFTIPDIYAFVTVRWTKHVGIDISGYKNLLRFLEDVGARPATVKAIASEK